MPTRLKYYLPLMLFAILAATVAAWAISTIMPMGSTRQSTSIRTFSRAIPLHQENNSVDVDLLRDIPKTNEEIEIEELNRRLLAEGLEPIVITSEPGNGTTVTIYLPLE